MCYRNEKNIYDWHISAPGSEVIILEDDGMGRVIIMKGMKVAAKIVFVDGLLKINTIEGFAVQIDHPAKIIQVIEE